ncbi:hypothetical protein RHMOL_Rhmol07G0063800 [Rhododendron molle]|uniref:Uncharacterized protein n=1 Tax=Rhododendron molle TaxID=49168 RepID=A0ACC0MYR9_RHOML|nr:hypothetical protein RHMOL_Rhmol07G0063800 [Rhododendron molle]
MNGLTASSKFHGISLFVDVVSLGTSPSPQVLVDKYHGLTGNLLVEHLDGARIDLLSKEEYAEVGSLGMQGNELTALVKDDITALDVAVSDLLANVVPIDVARNITGLNPETTLGKVLSFGLFSAEGFMLMPERYFGFYALVIEFLCVICSCGGSKTFTTAETMLNARTLREWISSALGLVL